jgi:hypothetical protein
VRFPSVTNRALPFLMSHVSYLLGAGGGGGVRNDC